MPPDDEVVVPLEVPLDVPLEDVLLEEVQLVFPPPLLPELVDPEDPADSPSVPSVPLSPLEPAPVGPVPEAAHPTAAVPPSRALAADNRKSRETLTTFYLRPNIFVGCGLHHC